MFALCASGTMNMQVFVWKFLRARNKCSFIHLLRTVVIDRVSSRVASATGPRTRTRICKIY